jgi:putative CocE/NonD family hydrolase
VGGATFLPGVYVGLHAGQRDQRAVEQRPDVLSYTGDVLSEDVELCGPVAVTLYAATSAPDTDWTAKLIDVYPDGRALNICDGIIRARYRHRTADDDLATPGEPHEFRIDLGSTSIVLFAGHALRLEISSSNFPRFDVNPNHGGVIAQSTIEDYVVAHQRIFHDRDRPSHLEVYTVPRQRRSRN